MCNECLGHRSRGEGQCAWSGPGASSGTRDNGVPFLGLINKYINGNGGVIGFELSYLVQGGWWLETRPVECVFELFVLFKPTRVTTGGIEGREDGPAETFFVIFVFNIHYGTLICDKLRRLYKTGSGRQGTIRRNVYNETSYIVHRPTGALIGETV